MLSWGRVHKRHSQGDTQTSQPEETTSLTSALDETALQWILEFQTSLEWLKKKVVKLQAALDAEQTQPPDALEKEKQNMTHTEHNLNHQPTMKVRSDDRPECKDIEEHQEEERWIPKTDMKGNLETLVSEDPQSGQCNGLTIQWSKVTSEEENPQMSSFRFKAPKGSSNIEEHQEWKTT